MTGRFASAQNSYLKVSAKNPFEKTIIDSVGYKGIHKDLESLFEETKNLSNKLTQLGYIENEITKAQKSNDSTFNYSCTLGKKVKNLDLYIIPNSKLKLLGIIEVKNDTLKIPYNSVETFLKQTLSKLENQGYPLSKVQLIDLDLNKGKMTASLSIELNQKRILNDIVIKGYDQFSLGHKKNLIRRYKNKSFNQEIVKNIQQDFEKLNFISLTKLPEILFTKDTTKIYVYIEKSKPNKFDGFVGFSNDKNNNLTFKGYLDLLLVNPLNSGESLSIYWKSDGENQKTFNIETEFPYVFKSRFGIKANLNIFKKDSLFQNTKTALDFGYFFNYSTRLYLGFQSTESSDIQNINNGTISDYKNKFITANFEFTKTRNDDYLFPEKSKLIAKLGFGSRNSNLSKNNQIYANVEWSHILFLDSKNNIHIKSQNYFLQSNQYIVNELYRFGGIHSIRGFNENSLQGNVFSSILTEYRYVIAPNLYIHSITDYGYFKDTLSKENNNLLGFGFGFGLLTKNGFLNLIYANGSTKNQSIKLSNSLIHLSFRIFF
jgi:hypothetical protein